MTFSNRISVPAGLLLFAAAAFAQLTGLEGDVKGVDGKLLPNAVVKIARIDVSRSYQVKTDKKGHYYYTGLPAGLYTVSVQVDGSDVAAITGIMTQPGAPLQVNFELADRPEQQAQKAVLSVRKVRGEWSFIKPVIIQEAPKQAAPPSGAQAVLPAEPSHAMTAGQKSVNDVFATGVAALDARRYEEAVENFDKAREAAPKQPLVWANLASAYVGLAGAKTGADADSALQKGLDAYVMAIALKPDDAVVRNNYARALARAGKFSEMQVEIKKSADLDPASASQSYYSLGALLTNVGKTDAAVDVFKVAIARGPDDPKNAEAYYQYAVALVSKAQVGADGKIVPAPGTVALLKKYLELAPNGPNAQGAKEMLATLTRPPRP